MWLNTLIFFVILALHRSYTSSVSEDRWDLDAYFDALDSSTKPQDRIVGGDNVAEGEYIAYQVSIQYLRNDSYRHFCGGSIISPNRILTAAHCVVGQNPKTFTILAGVTNLDATDGQRSQVEVIDAHQKYERLKRNDIAILSINPPLVLDGQRMDKINVYYPEEIGSDETTILTGWGSTRHARNSPAYPKMLQILNYQTISNAECKKKMKNLTETEICAKAPRGKGACGGDSGGPLAMDMNGEMIQVGIVSYGRRTCGSDGLDVYTRVSMFNDWITERNGSEN